MSKKMIADIYPLSPMQEGMLYHYIVDEKAEQYFEQTCFEIKGKIDLGKFELAWNHVIQNNEVLRTVFKWDGVKKPVQIVLAERPARITMQDLTSIPKKDIGSALAELQRKDRQAGFDLAKGPLTRVIIPKFSKDHYAIIWSYHHIIMDGWSTGIILKEVFDAYQQLLKGSKLAKSMKYRFKDYLKFLESQDQIQGLRYWKEYLAGFNSPTRLPVNLQQSEKVGFGETVLELSHTESQAVQMLARECRVTLNVVIQVVWGIMLQRYNHGRDSVFGATVSGRPHQLVGIQESVGLFINTLPVRIQSSANLRIVDLLKQQMESNLRQKDYEYLSLALVTQQSELAEHGALFDSILVFENYPLDQALNAMALDLEIINTNAHEMTNYNLTLTILPGECLRIKFNYPTDLYPLDFIQRVAEQFRYLLSQLSQNPEGRVLELHLLTEAERRAILDESTGSIMPVPERCIHQLISEQIRKTPEATALVYQNKSLTYAELQVLVQRCAYQLQSVISIPDTIVPIMVDRSLEMVIGLLAILQAGGAYLPLDPNYPENRLQYMLDDSEAELIVVGEAQQLNIPTSYTGQVLVIDNMLKQMSETTSSEVQEITNNVTPTSLAYVIYTSGSTGKPKGIMIEHHSVVNLITDLSQRLAFTAGQSFLALTTISFDISVLEIFLTLASGMRVVIASSEAQRDPELLAELMLSENIEKVQMTPSTLQMLLSSVGKLPECVKTILLGGEPLPPLLLKELQSVTDLYIHNMYGPTETTIWSLTGDLTSEQEVHLGSPLANTRVYTLDLEGDFVPEGVLGEIYIAGRGLARGYLHRAELTQERFLPDPFCPGEFMYRTGDLGCRHLGGNLTFHGRLDYQVKIRGFRIELGEIEKVLNTHPAIRESVVHLYHDSGGEKSLAGYLVLTESHELDQLQLREYLLKVLPEYMIPTVFMSLNSLPLTPNGKIDRKALPIPEYHYQSKHRYVPPRNQTEEIMTQIWTEVLERDQIGIYDNFFELGGHSLKITRIISRIHKTLGIKIPLNTFFKNPTIAGLVDELHLIKRGDCARARYQQIPVQPERDYYPTSHAQRRLWVIDRLEEEVTAYAMPAAYRLQGKLNTTALEHAFQTLVQRHQALQTGFKILDDEPVQYIEPDFKVTIQYLKSIELIELPALLKKEAETPFDLSQAGLIRVKLCELAEADHLLLITVHHIVFDEWSRMIFISELTTLYNSYVTQELPDLPPLRIQYRDYAVWQQNLLHSNKMQEFGDFWLNQLAGELPELNLPTDKPRPQLKSDRGDHYHFTLSTDLIPGLYDLAQKQNVTLFMVFLTAYYILLYRYTGQEDLIIGIPSTNRQDEDLEQMIGFFVNTLPFRLTIQKEEPFNQLLDRVRRLAIAGFAYQEYPLDQLIDQLQLKWNTSRSLLFDTIFNLTEMNAVSLHLKDLQVQTIEQKSKTSKNDLILNLSLDNQTIIGSIEFCTDLFESQTIQLLVQHYQNLLTSIVQNPTDKIDQLNLLSEEEEKNLRAGWRFDQLGSRLQQELYRRCQELNQVIVENAHYYLLDSAKQLVASGGIGKIYLITSSVNFEQSLIAENFAETGIWARLYPSGLVDLLQQPISSRSKDKNIQPQTEVEEQLVEIWQEILNVQYVGVADNFFDLGGTSLDIATLYLKIKVMLDYPIQVADLFTYQTIQSLLGYIETQLHKPNESSDADLFHKILDENITSKEARQMVFKDTR